MKIILGSDHAGYELKEAIKERLIALENTVEDYGTNTEQACDYPDIGLQVAEKVIEDEENLGILICGTGVGMSISANKVPGVRAALVYNIYVAQYAREHNNANIIVLPGRVIGKDMAMLMINAWLTARFSGDRHQRRLDKIVAIEKKYSN